MHLAFLSDLENELKQSIAERDSRDTEMETLTRDLADLIPVSEHLKEENDRLKASIKFIKKYGTYFLIYSWLKKLINRIFFTKRKSTCCRCRNFKL